MGWLQRTDPYWVVALLVLSSWIAWRLVRIRWTRRRVSGDDEVQIVFAVAALCEGTRSLTTLALVRAALCNAEVAAAFERRGVAVEAAAARLDELVGPRAETKEISKELKLDAPLQEAVNVASVAASGRGDAEFSLADLMTAIAERGGPAADYLNQLGVTFDETWVATTFGDPAPEECFVYLWNDDTSPMEKVVEVLREVFGVDELRASYLMMSVHLRGFVALGPFVGREADRLVDETNAFAHQLEIPLQVRRDPPDTRGWRQTPRHGFLP